MKRDFARRFLMLIMVVDGQGGRIGSTIIGELLSKSRIVRS